MKNTERIKRKTIYVIAVVVAVLVVVGIGITVGYAAGSGSRQTGKDDTGTLNSSTAANASTEDAEAEHWQEGVITYNGKQYQYNTAIKTYLIMGIDKDGPVEPAEDGISGGQSDAMFLLIQDTRNERMSIIAINRNTMTDIDVYDADGNYVGRENRQICLQHGYGDGMRTSCLRSVDAVSRLFYGIPISGYLALNLDAIPILNDSVGGVEVTVLNDIENTAKHVTLQEGETLTLTGDQAYAYIRTRDIDEFDSATMRLERQKQYIVAFLEKAKEQAKQDKGSILRMYEAAEDYMIESVDFVRLAENLTDYEFRESDLYTVPGEVFAGERYEEFYVDEDGLYQMIIDIFYEPVSNDDNERY